MKRWAWLILALAATAASARLTTFAWDSDPSWPTGTTVELCSNGICARGITETQHTLDVPIEPGEHFYAAARAVTADGQTSEWTTLVQTWPGLPIGLWAYGEVQEQTVATFESSTFVGSSGVTSVTANVPSGVQDGNLLLAVLAVTDSNATLVNDVTGWTKLINDFKLYNLGSGTGLCVFWRIASSEPASYDFTLTGSRRLSVSMTRWSGVDNTTPIASYSTNNTYSTADTTVRSSSVTTAVNGQTVVNVAGIYDSNTTTYTPPTNYTEHVDTGNTNGRTWLEISSYAWPTAGSTGDVDATASRADQEKGGIALVLNDAAAGGATALPRRAVDGPFYGALRGSVR